MTLDPMTAIRCQMAVAEVLGTAKEVALAPDLEEAIAQLDNLWGDVHRARQVLRAAEKEARKAALAKIGETA